MSAAAREVLRLSRFVIFRKHHQGCHVQLLGCHERVARMARGVF